MSRLYKICSVLGTPTTVSWPEGFKLAAQIGYRFPQRGSLAFEGLEVITHTYTYICIIQYMFQIHMNTE